MPKKAPKYEMDPSFWQLPTEPPPLYEEKDPLAIEAPAADIDDDEDEGDDEGEEDVREANKILDGLGLPNYDDAEMRLAEPETTAAKQRNYLGKVIKVHLTPNTIFAKNANLKLIQKRFNIFSQHLKFFRATVQPEI